MNISKNQVDDLNLIVSIDVDKTDYQTVVNDVLRDYRRKANMPGFRPGKIPDGLIRKMYGKSVLVEELNKLVSEALNGYIEGEKLDILGDPLSVTEGEDFEWEIGNNFTFAFEIGLSPRLDIQLSEADKLVRYRIAVSDQSVDDSVETYAMHYGNYVEADTVVEMTEKLTGNIIQLDGDRQPMEDGLSATDTVMLLSLITKEELKKPFENASVNDAIDFPLAATFPNEWEIASILKRNGKEELNDIHDALFRFTIVKIEMRKKAELNAELFDNVLGANMATSIEEFKAHIRKDLETQMEDSATQKFYEDVRKYLREKYHPPLPEAFLRKYLWHINKDKVEEKALEQQFPDFLEKTRLSVISGDIVRRHNIKVDEQEVIDYAKEETRRQLVYYGIRHLDDEKVTNYAMESLREDSRVRGYISVLIDKKIMDVVMQSANVAIKDITPDEFDKLTSQNYKNETL
ncbi:MAG: trigger factor [Bacteroidales bacterium]|nr:trigger factor [Bacteroidales bacterium]